MDRIVGRVTYPLVCGGALLAAALLLARGVRPFLVTTAITVVLALLVAGLERLVPHRKDWLSSHGDVLTDSLHLGASAFLVWVADIAGPRIHAAMPLWPTAVPIPVQLVLALFIRELGAYGCHRALHGFPFLWRFHAIHHSSERLYWLNGTRNHPVDVLLITACTLGPLTLLGAPASVLALMNAYVSAHLLLQHSNVRISLGRVNWFINSAEVHRWHHALDPRESLANFSHVILFWDIVFGTWRPRTHQGPPAVGIAGSDVPPTDYVGQLVYPLKVARGPVPQAR